MRKLPLSYASSRFEKQMQFKEMSWEGIKQRLSKPVVSSETYAEYLEWDRERQTESKDVGYYIIGEFANGLRHNSEFKSRGTITLDIDTPGLDFRKRLVRVFGKFEFFWHTSRKSNPNSPRIRVHLPLSQNVSSTDEYEALARHAATLYGFDLIDKISFVGAQMMFNPSASSDGIFEFGSNTGEWLDPSAVLFDAFYDWRDRTEWPRGANEPPPENRKERADSPLSKPGIIGAWCRVFSITDVLERVIPGVYEPAGEGRWRYHLAEGAGGGIVYDDDTAFYSHHSNHDPGANRSLNAWDLCRVHLFHEFDEGIEKDSLSPTQMPSFKAMQNLALSDDRWAGDVLEELHHEGKFDDIEDVVPAVAGSAGVGVTDRDELGSSLSGESSYDDGLGTSLRPAAAGEPIIDDLSPKPGAALTRAQIRELITAAEDGDTLTDAAVKRVAAGGFEPAVEAGLVAEISKRFAQVTGLTLSKFAIAKSVTEFKRVLRGARELVPVEGALPSEVRRDEDGMPENSVDNMCVWIEEGGAGYHIGFDDFTGEECIAPLKTNDWKPITEEDQIRIRRTMERASFKTFGGGNDLLKQAIKSVGEKCVFDAAQVWLRNLIWDGCERAEMFFITYYGCADNAYVRACGRYWWSALAGRVAKPGVKADMMPILFGMQGMRKSSSVEAMVPHEDYAGIFEFKNNDQDQGRAMEGKLIAEWSELRGLLNQDEDAIKTFLSRRKDTWIPKYKEKERRRWRRIMFMGTTDKEEFLSDAAGHRRYLPLEPTFADVEAIKRDHEQLYAEGLELFVALGCRVDHGAEHLAKQAHEKHTESGAWDDKVEEFLALPAYSDDLEDVADRVKGDGRFKAVEVLQFIGTKLPDIKRKDLMEVGRILKRLGYANKTTTSEGKPGKWWMKKIAE